MRNVFQLRNVLCLFVVCAAASHATAALPNQPWVIPADGDYGAFSTRDQDTGPTDPLQAKSYDNFTLDTAYVIDSICWAGLYAEPFPTSGANETDFVIEIWGNSAGVPNLSAPLFAFNVEGGIAGVSDGDVPTTPLGHVSPVTSVNPIGGGKAYTYSTDVTNFVLPAGNYWISIIADQKFDNPNDFDPEWMWHLGTGPHNGFYNRDFQLDPLGTPDYGIFFQDKDLAFQLKGTAVPEPAGMLLGLLSVAGMGLFRRKRA